MSGTTAGGAGSEAFFALGDAAVDGGVQRRAGRGLAATAGPWTADAMHGGPPSALLVRACEEAAGADGPPLVAVRAAVDFLGPVPLGDLEVTARLVRPGRRVALAEATMHAAGRPVLTARTWFLAVAAGPVPLPPGAPDGSAGTEPVPPPDDLAQVGGRFWTSFPYARAVEWRPARGDADGPGDAAVWARPRIPLVAGEEPSGLQRAVLVADSSSGVSAGLDWASWQFVNVDLTVHLARPLVGDWVCLDARSGYAPSGTGLARATLHDQDGVVGASAQSLVVAPAR